MYQQIEGMLSAEDAADQLLLNATNIAAAIKRNDNCFFVNRKASLNAVLELLTQYVNAEQGAPAVPSDTGAVESENLDRFDLANAGENPGGYSADAARSGDKGIYNEIRAGIYHGDVCVADVLIGINPAGEPRVMCTVNGDGDNGQQIAIFPLRSADDAVVFEPQ